MCVYSRRPFFSFPSWLMAAAAFLYRRQAVHWAAATLKAYRTIASREYCVERGGTGGWFWRDRVRQSAGPSLSRCVCDCLSSSLFNSSNFLVKKYKKKNLLVPRQKSNHKIGEREIEKTSIYRLLWCVRDEEFRRELVYTGCILSLRRISYRRRSKKQKKKHPAIRKVIFSLLLHLRSFFSYIVYNNSFIIFFFVFLFLHVIFCVCDAVLARPFWMYMSCVYFHLVSARYVTIALSDFFFFIRIVFFSFATFGFFRCWNKKLGETTRPRLRRQGRHTHTDR
jgi:hypothetical protein